MSRAKRIKRQPERETPRLIPESELRREAQRLIATGKMPSLSDVLRAMREVKRELTVPLTERVQ